jgi:hypothetical protein
MKCFIEPIATPISGKHTAGPICAVCSGSQTYDQQPGSGVAERGKRLAPVILVGEATRLGSLDVLPVIYEPRALTASNDTAL